MTVATSISGDRPSGCCDRKRWMAGLVAAMTKSEPHMKSKKSSIMPLVNRDSAPRRATCLAVQSDVGELCFLGSGS